MKEAEVEALGWLNLAKSYSASADYLLSAEDDFGRPADLLCAHALETSLKGLVVLASDGPVEPKELGHSLLLAWDKAKNFSIGKKVLEKAQNDTNIFWRERWRRANDERRAQIESSGFLVNEADPNFDILSNKQLGDELPKLRDIACWYGERNDTPHHQFRYPWNGIDYRMQASVGGKKFDIAPLTAVTASKSICQSMEHHIRSTL